MTRTIAILALLISLAVSTRAVAQTTLYLKPSEALKLIFKDSQEVVKEDKTLDAAAASAFKAKLGYEPPKDSYTFYIGKSNGKPDGYALIDEQIGKVMPITFVTRINPDAKVAMVEIMVYRETHGGEVASKRFLNQFKGKGLNEELRLYGNIVNVAGATLSSEALVTGVKRAQFLWKQFYGS